MILTKPEFKLLSDYVQRACGILIPEDKQYLICQRLEPLAVSIGCTTFGELYSKLNSGYSYALRDQLLDAITTQETSFFRDGHPFITFKDHILPELAKSLIERKKQGYRTSNIRVWSAGSSTGQEPYSIAILCYEYAKEGAFWRLNLNDFDIVASDISRRALAKAKSGEYNKREISKGLSTEQRNKYFNCKDGNWSIKDNIRNLIVYRRINLIEPFSLLGSFDIIFCRNVLIYFDIETKQKICEQFHKMLIDGGYLILGNAENLYGISNSFKSVKYGKTLFYQKVALRSKY